MARRSHGELESLTLDALWSCEGWATAEQVREILGERSPELAYTTVQTILVRLWKKGMLERERDGRAFRYRPVATREAWTATRMRELLAAAGNPDAALTHFVAEIDPTELRALRRLLDDRA